MTRNHRRDDHAGFDNRPTAAQQAAQKRNPKTLGTFRQSASNWAWSASQSFQSAVGWIGLVVLVLSTVTALGFAGYILFTVLGPVP